MLLNDFTLKGFDARISASLPFANETAAGQTSSSTRINKGIKPKEISVAISIRYADASDLTDLVAVAESVNDEGALTVYDIVDDTANAMKIKQVQFVGNLTAAESEGQKFWRVTFKLAEHLSIPEIIEKRQDTGTPAEQAVAGDAVSSEPVSSESEEELTGFEAVLKKLDNKLA